MHLRQANLQYDGLWSEQRHVLIQDLRNARRRGARLQKDLLKFRILLYLSLMTNLLAAVALFGDLLF